MRPWPEFRGSIARASCASAVARYAVLPLIASAALVSPAPALAQLAGNVTLQSNQTFRGETISRDDPGIAVALSVDSDTGLYVGADASFAAGSGKPRFTAANQYAGYAVKRGALSLEAGVVHRNYGSMFDTAYRKQFFEFYAGASFRRIRLRAYVSPDYLIDGRTTYYIDASAGLATISRWRIDGHAGLSLIPPDLTERQGYLRTYADWSLRASRPLGRFTFSAAVTATNYPVFSPSGKARFSASLSRAF